MNRGLEAMGAGWSSAGGSTSGCCGAPAPALRPPLASAHPAIMAPVTLNLGAILTAMVTPFDARGRIDEEATVSLMHHLVEHGSDGLVVCGTTGEAATLDD